MSNTCVLDGIRPIQPNRQEDYTIYKKYDIITDNDGKAYIDTSDLPLGSELEIYVKNYDTQKQVTWEVALLCFKMSKDVYIADYNQISPSGSTFSIRNDAHKIALSCIGGTYPISGLKFEVYAHIHQLISE